MSLPSRQGKALPHWHGAILPRPEGRGLSRERVNGSLFLSTSGTFDTLQLIDTSTGVNTSIGSIGFGSVLGLASPNGNDLYGFSGNEVLLINTTTGAGSRLSTANGSVNRTVYGAAFRTEAMTAAIPEPETYALMLAGLGAVGVAASWV